MPKKDKKINIWDMMLITRLMIFQNNLHINKLKLYKRRDEAKCFCKKKQQQTFKYHTESSMWWISIYLYFYFPADGCNRYMYCIYTPTHIHT